MTDSYPPGYTEPTEEESEYYANLVQREQDAYLRGYAAARKELLAKAEEWCSINAYDSDKGVCDRHTCDDERGRICSAGELLDYLKLEAKENGE